MWSIRLTQWPAVEKYKILAEILIILSFKNVDQSSSVPKTKICYEQSGLNCSPYLFKNSRWLEVQRRIQALHMRTSDKGLPNGNM